MNILAKCTRCLSDANDRRDTIAATRLGNLGWTRDMALLHSSPRREAAEPVLAPTVQLAMVAADSYSSKMVPLHIPRLLATLFLALCCLGPNTPAAYEISSSARVNEDGTLRIRGKTIHLYGIHIPELDRTCNTNRRPTFCGSRAAVALEFKIDGFVRCELLEENEDGSYVGHCRVDATHFDEGEDLSAYLLERGWAVALPDAPVEYQALEKIARSRGLGHWGFPVDRIDRR